MADPQKPGATDGLTVDTMLDATRPSNLSNAVMKSRFVESIASGLVVFCLVFVGSANIPIVNGDEARFAQASREMLERGDLIVPTFAGLPRFDKPILIYWLVAASFDQLGRSPRTARLPSNIAAACAAALLAWTARRRWGPGTGWLAALLLAVSGVFHVQARACTADSVTFLCTLAAMLALEQVVNGSFKGWRPAALWVALGLGILTKGPVTPLYVGSTLGGLWAFGRHWRKWEVVFAGILIAAGAFGLGPVVLLVPAGAAVAHFLANPVARRRAASSGWWWGIPLLVAIVLPWSAAAWRATHGAYFKVAIGRHVVERSVTALESHGGFPGFYLASALVLAFPWISILGRSSAAAWNRRAEDPQARFLLAWLFGSLIVLEVLGTKLVHYWMPAYPAAILLVISWLRDLRRSPAGRGAVLVHAVGGILLASAPVLVVVRFGLGDLRVSAWATTFILVLATVWAACRLRSRPLQAVVISVAGTAVFLFLLFGSFVPGLAEHMIGPRTADRVVQLLQPDDALILHRLRDEDLLFDLPSRLEVSRSRDDLAQRIDPSKSTLIIVRKRDIEDANSALRGRPYEVVDSIEGIDLGRGRMAENILIRTP